MSHRAFNLGLALAAAFAIMAATFSTVPAAHAAQDVVEDDIPILDEPRIMDGRVYVI